MNENLVAKILNDHKELMMAHCQDVCDNIEADKLNFGLRYGLWAIQWYIAGIAGVQKAAQNILETRGLTLFEQRKTFVQQLASSVKDLDDILSKSPTYYKMGDIDIAIKNASPSEFLTYLESVYGQIHNMNFGRILDSLSQQKSLNVPLTNMAYQWYLLGATVVLEYVKKNNRKSLDSLNNELLYAKTHYAQEFTSIENNYLIFPVQRVIIV